MTKDQKASLQECMQNQTNEGEPDRKMRTNYSLTSDMGDRTQRIIKRT